ncbi:unnamed protein product, partial [Ectocarpus sp. 8 AP-2014]
LFFFTCGKFVFWAVPIPYTRATNRSVAQELIIM